MSELEYTTKEMIAYFLVANKNISDFKNKTISNFRQELIQTMKNIDKKNILNKVNTAKFYEFPIKYSINITEILNYATVIFYRLLNYYNREFTENDLIKEIEYVMTRFSTRTINDEISRIGSNLINQ